MEDNKEDKSIKILSLCFILIQFFIISLFLLFIIGVSKVNAAIVCIGYNGSTEVFNTNNNGQGNIPSYTGALTYIKCYDTNYNLEGTNKTFTYGMSINIEYQTANPWTPNINYNMNGGYIDNVNSLSFKRSDKCYFNTYRQDNDTTVALLNGKNRRLYGSMTCNGVDGQSSYTPPAFIIEFTSSGSNSSRNYKGAFTGQIATIAFDESTNQEEVISEIGQQTADLVNQINSQTNAIISNADDNTDRLIEHNTYTADRIIEEIKDAWTTCKNYDLGNSFLNTDGYFNSEGIIRQSQGWYYTSQYIEVNQGVTYTITKNYDANTDYCLYDENKNLIGNCVVNQSSRTISITPNQKGYIRYDGKKTYSNYITRLQGQYCYNTIEKQNEISQNIWDKINENGWTMDNPNETPMDDLEDSEEGLQDYLIDDTDIENLDYSVDSTTNQVIWQIFNNIVTTNEVFYTAFLTIMFIGIIKLILAR